jgi:putative PIN family toxin of toxin-antitoxin system
VGRKLLHALLEGRHILLLSNEIITETVKVLRYPRLQKLHALSDGQLYNYAQFLREVSETVILAPAYHAPLRDSSDLDVLQTAERGEADVLCSNDGDFHEEVIVQYCSSRGIYVCNENALLSMLTRS